MTPSEHKNYAKELMTSLSDQGPEDLTFSFDPNYEQSRNAARAMTAILCQRLSNESHHRPVHKVDTTYEWKEGIFNCRNIADRDYLWTNIRQTVADQFHTYAENRVAAYLLAFSEPADTTISFWVLPEPILYDSLSSLPEKPAGDEFSIQIKPLDQRIEHFSASPDLTEYFGKFSLSQHELRILNEAREVDAFVRRGRKLAKAAAIAPDSEVGKALAVASEELDKGGYFDPEGITDARQRVLASIVRRRGRSAFRQRVIHAYNGKCAISGCDVQDVLEAAHIVPYKGPETNHLRNGMLLRADIHVLFDLKLLSVDVTNMTVIVSSPLADTIYGEYHGRSLIMPNDQGNQPSHEALEQHRKESGL